MSSPNEIDPNFIKYLHTDPLYDLKQSQRCEKFLNIAQHYTNIKDSLSDYHSFSNKAIESLSLFISELKQFDSITSSQELSAQFDLTVKFYEAQKTLLLNLEASVINPLNILMKNDINSLVEAKHNSTLHDEKYEALLEKFVATPAKATSNRRIPLDQIIDLHTQAAISYFDFIDQLNIAETSFEGVINSTVCIFFLVRSLSFIINDFTKNF